MGAAFILALLPFIPIWLHVIIQTSGLYFYHTWIHSKINKTLQEEHSLNILKQMKEAIKTQTPMIVASQHGDVKTWKNIPIGKKRLATSFLQKLEDLVQSVNENLLDQALLVSRALTRLDPALTIYYPELFQLLRDFKKTGVASRPIVWPLTIPLMEYGIYFDIEIDETSLAWPRSLKLSTFKILQIEKPKKSDQIPTVYVERINGKEESANPPRDIPGHYHIKDVATTPLPKPEPSHIRHPYWKLFVLPLPIMETMLFQTGGFSLLSPTILGHGFSLSSANQLAISVLAVLFAATHTIVRWLVRSKQTGRSAQLDFAIRTGLFFLFSTPFFFTDQLLLATYITSVIHGIYNILILSNWLPDWMPLASVIPPEDESFKPPLFPKASIHDEEVVRTIMQETGANNYVDLMSPSNLHTFIQNEGPSATSRGYINIDTENRVVVLVDDRFESDYALWNGHVIAKTPAKARRAKAELQTWASRLHFTMAHLVSVDLAEQAMAWIHKGRSSASQERRLLSITETAAEAKERGKNAEWEFPDELRKLLISVAYGSMSPDNQTPNQILSTLESWLHELSNTRQTNSYSTLTYWQTLELVARFKKGFEMAASFETGICTELINTYFYNQDFDEDAFIYSLLNSRIENINTLTNLVVWLTSKQRGQEAYILYRRLKTRLQAQGVDIEHHMRRAHFDFNSRYPAKESSHNEQAARRYLSEHSDILNLWLAANTFEEAVDLILNQDHADLMFGLSEVYFRDRFMVGLEFITNEEQAQQYLSKNIKKVVPLDEAWKAASIGKLYEWADRLDPYSYEFHAFNCNWEKMAVCKQTRAAHWSHSGTMVLDLNDGVQTLHHELGHAFDPELIQKRKGYLPNGAAHPYGGVERSALTAFAEKYGYDISGSQSNNAILPVLIDLIPRVFRRRREGWKVLARLATHFDSTRDPNIGFWEGYIADLEIEKLEVIAALEKIDPSLPNAGTTYLDGLESRSIPLSSNIGIEYDTHINILKRELENGIKAQDIPFEEADRGLFNTREINYRTLHEMVKDLLPAGISTDDSHLPLNYKYMFDVPKADDGNRLKDPNLTDNVRADHYEWFAEQFRVFSLDPEVTKAADREIYDLFSIMFANGKRLYRNSPRKPLIDSLFRFVNSARDKEYTDSLRSFMAQWDPSVEFLRVDGFLDLIYRRLGYAFSEIIKNAINANLDYAHINTRIDEKFLRHHLEKLSVTSGFDADGNYFISVGNSGDIDPKSFSTEKLERLKKLIAHLYYVIMNTPDSGVPAPHPDLSSLRFNNDGIDDGLALEITKYAKPSMALLDRMIEKSKHEGLSVEDAKELIFAPLITTKIDLFTSRYFDWDGKEEQEVDDFFGGRGLGMASAKRFLNEMEINVDAETGQGATRFIIKIPKKLIVTPSNLKGGTMLWMRDWLFPGMATHDYALKKAWWVENVFVLGVGLIIGLAIFAFAGDLRFAVQGGNTIGWGLFVVGHGVDFLRKNGERAPPGNMILSGFIAFASIGLPFLPLSTSFLIPTIVLGSTLTHALTNFGAARFATPTISSKDNLEAQLVAFLKSSGRNRRALAHAILNEMPVEKVFGDAASTRKTLRKTLASLLMEGSFDSVESRLRLADIAFLLRRVLPAPKTIGFVGPLGEIPNPNNFDTPRISVSWVSAIDQTQNLIRSMLQNKTDRLVIGWDESTASHWDAFQQNTDLPLSDLMAEGRLAFVVGKPQTTAITLLTQAKETAVLKDNPEAIVNLMVMEGSVLPDRFFELSSLEWNALHRHAVVYFVTQALNAVAVPVNLLPNWKALRSALIQA